MRSVSRPDGGPLLDFAGGHTGITSVLLVMMLSQPRVLLAMARDGLLPPDFFGAIHDRFKTPWKSTILTGIVVGVMGSLLPLACWPNWSTLERCWRL